MSDSDFKNVKENSISNNLINLRERLNASRAAILAGEDPLQPPKPPKTVKSKTVEIDEQFRRDLAILTDRMAMESAGLESAGEDLHEALEKYELYSKKLAEIREEVKSCRDERTFELLRMQFFDLSGRIAQLHRRNAAGSSGPAMHEQLPENWRITFRRYMPLILSFWAAVLLLAATFVLLFA